MGYDSHHAIIVSAQSKVQLSKARLTAVYIFGSYMVSGILESPVNGWEHFFVCPDGSKEGWEESDVGDSNRDAFIEYLASRKYDDGSSPLKWVEIQYGDDGGETKVVRDSDE